MNTYHLFKVYEKNNVYECIGGYPKREGREGIILMNHLSVCFWLSTACRGREGQYYYGQEGRGRGGRGACTCAFILLFILAISF